MSLLIDLEAIGQRISGLRGKISQADFAAKLGIDRKTVGTWERGERLPDTRALLVLWNEFDADPAWVLTGSGFAPATSDDERELLALFRSAPLAGKMAAVGALQGALDAGGANSQAQRKAAKQESSAPDMRRMQMTNSANGGVQIGYAGGKVSIKKGR